MAGLGVWGSQEEEIILIVQLAGNAMPMQSPGKVSVTALKILGAEHKPNGSARSTMSGRPMILPGGGSHLGGLGQCSVSILEVYLD